MTGCATPLIPCDVRYERSAPDPNIEPLLAVDNLKTHIFLKRGVVKAVDGVSFTLAPKETLGLIGESGSGKTMTGLSILGLPPRPAGRIVAGSIRLEGRELVGLSEKTLAQEVRGSKVAMISQDPMTSLNPVFTVGDQVAAPLRAHGLADRRSAMDLAVNELDRVRVPSATQRAADYPASVQRRYAPTRGRRHGHRLSPEGVDRGRADQCP